MKKITYILFALFLMTVVANAQKSILSGIVKDEQGNALSGATILIKGSFIGSSADIDGNYSISVTKGTYDIEYSFIGYESISRTVDLSSDKTVDIVLKEKTYLGTEVIVKAIKASSESPFAQTTINKADIDKKNVNSDIPFQLEMTPSAVATSENGTGYGYSALRIRGTDLSRINITINGIPYNDPESQGVYFVNMPDFSASTSEVQIQRGVGTSANGSAAFGASINFQTLGIEEKPYSRLATTIGSFGTFKRSFAAGTGLLNNKFAFDFRYSKLTSDGYIQNGFTDHSSFFLSGTYSSKKSLLKANVIIGEQKTGITWWGVPDYMIDSIRNYNPAGVYYDEKGNEHYYKDQTDNYWQNHYQLFYSYEANNYLNINLSGFVVTGKGYYEQYKEDENISDYGITPFWIGSDSIVGLTSLELEDSSITTTDIIRQKWLDNIYYGSSVSLNYSKDRINISTGGGYNTYDGDHFGKIKWSTYNIGIPYNYEWYHNTGKKSEAHGFGKVSYKINKSLIAYADLQVRSIFYTMRGPDDDGELIDQEHNYLFINPKFGVSYFPNTTNKLYASFGQANREPTRADLKDAVKNGGTDFPKAELLNDFEAGYMYKSRNIKAGINIYYMLYKDQLVQTGELSSVGYPIMTNVENSFRRGIEILYGFRLLNIVTFEGNTALSQNKITDYIEYAEAYDSSWNYFTHEQKLGTTDISYSPNFVQSVQLGYSFFKNAGVQFIVKSVGKQYIDNTSDKDRTIDAYSKADIQLVYKWVYKSGKTIDFQFVVNNVLNAKYNTNAYGGNWYEQGKEFSWVYYFPSAPINFATKILIHL